MSWNPNYQDRAYQILLTHAYKHHLVIGAANVGRMHPDQEQFNTDIANNYQNPIFGKNNSWETRFSQEQFEYDPSITVALHLVGNFAKENASRRATVRALVRENGNHYFLERKQEVLPPRLQNDGLCLVEECVSDLHRLIGKIHNSKWELVSEESATAHQSTSLLVKTILTISSLFGSGPDFFQEFNH